MTQSTAEYDFLYDSPTGPLGVCIDAESITKIIWLEQDVLATTETPPSKSINSKLKQKVVSALDNYFESGLFEGDISLSPDGSRFQKKVWQALKRIPSGTVKTYGDVAKELKTSSRAVGQACRRNNIPLFIPCHRVVAAQGIGGFMGGYRHVERKRWLLQHEGIL
ncbi:MAG: cysteine methyltransferase [Gammaproteobacteria bacterium]|nr:MAG: cysteine methyltransferase [Gammaproteobacteria bacterium]RKZ67070.1 MAG: cysteine methyltransferase [Gammaproteobacteria bacterium]